MFGAPTFTSTPAAAALNARHYRLRYRAAATPRREHCQPSPAQPQLVPDTHEPLVPDFVSYSNCEIADRAQRHDRVRPPARTQDRRRRHRRRRHTHPHPPSRDPRPPRTPPTSPPAQHRAATYSGVKRSACLHCPAPEMLPLGLSILSGVSADHGRSWTASWTDCPQWTVERLRRASLRQRAASIERVGEAANRPITSRVTQPNSPVMARTC
jgi:hypothetical protein